MLSRLLAASLLLSAVASPVAVAFTDPVDPPAPAPADPLDLGDGWTAQLGAEVRMRAMNTDNFALTGASPSKDNFYLSRVRLMADIEHESGWGFYVEAIDARITSNSLPAMPGDQNDLDLRNAFVRFAMADTSIRVGRTDLLYGSQRLVSPLDWANTRRTFEGVVFSQKTSDGFVDVFLTHPVIKDSHDFDHDDDSNWFGGVYWAAGQEEGSEGGLDAYLLTLNEQTNKIATGGPPPMVAADLRGANIYTYGTRLWGKPGDVDWELEVARQSGNTGGFAQRAWMAGARAGYTLQDVGWTPRLGFDIEYGSGDDDPNDSTNGTFNQLFPLAHPYYGEMDQVARQNSIAFVPNVTLHIDERTDMKLAYNYFRLDEETDALYNAGGAVLFVDPTGNSGDNVGRELNMILTHRPENLPFADVIRLGLNTFNPGRFVALNGSTKSAHLFYLELLKRF